MKKLLILLLLFPIALYGQGVYKTMVIHKRGAGGGGGGFDWTECDYYYNFDQTTGNLIDQADSDNGTPYVTSQSATGILNGAWDFDGTNDYVSFTGYSVGSQDISVSLWVWVQDNTSTQFWTGGADNGAMAFGHWGSGLILAESGVGTYSGITSSITIPDETWCHVVMVYDQTANQVTFYVNGTSEVESFSYNFTYANTIIGGRKSGVGSGWHDGLMDEMAIFLGYKLTSDEVTELYGSGTPPSYE